MSAPPNEDDIIQTERCVLQALCQGAPEGSVREAAKVILRHYRWHEPLHQMIFNLLVEMPTDDPEVIRDLLPSRLTRKGFPDVAWEDFFQPHPLSKEEAERLMQHLRALP